MLMRNRRAWTCWEVPRVMAAVKSGRMNCWVAWVMKPANAASLMVTPTRATSAVFKKKPAMRVTMSAKEAATAANNNKCGRPAAQYGRQIVPARPLEA